MNNEYLKLFLNVDITISEYLGYSKRLREPRSLK
jgi:hypothetical protein